jgi:hypothetical protein
MAQNHLASFLALLGVAQEGHMSLPSHFYFEGESLTLGQLQ